jgi:hypothetical protein
MIRKLYMGDDCCYELGDTIVAIVDDIGTIVGQGRDVFRASGHRAATGTMRFVDRNLDGSGRTLDETLALQPLPLSSTLAAVQDTAADVVTLRAKVRSAWKEEYEREISETQQEISRQNQLWNSLNHKLQQVDYERWLAGDSPDLKKVTEGKQLSLDTNRSRVYTYLHILYQKLMSSALSMMKLPALG